MKKFYISIILLFLFNLGGFSQARYFDAMFPVERLADVEYGTNVGILTGMPAPELLKLDLYLPVGDTKTDRPLVLIAHTGSFLPPLYNGQVTGSRTDSTVVASAAYFASRGFVVAAYSYRLGWLPTSPDQNVRTGSLLQAAFRGIQDTRTCIRYFKKTVAEEGNKYGIDPGKICVYGIGTGGYLALGSGCVNDWSEVTLPKFINTQTLLPYIDSTIFGNLYATSQAAICIPNHVNYSSDFQISVNLGGALGDSSWLDGDAVEPAYTGVHCVNDFFAPYYEGAVIVPTTNQFVVYATGTRKCIETANNLGSNDVFKNVDPSRDVLKDLITGQKSENITLPLTGQNIQLGTDNFYGFNIPLIFNGRPVPQGSPWDWWDYNTLKVVVGLVNSQRGTMFDADTLHLNGLATNPDMSPAKGRRYLDSVYALCIPRMCVAMDLGCQTVGLPEVKAEEIGLNAAPVPASNYVQVSTAIEHPMEAVYIFDLDGRLVKAHTEIRNSQFTLQKNQLKSGLYLMKVKTKSNLAYKKIVFQD